MSKEYSRSRREFIAKLTSAVGGGAAMAATSGMVQAAPVEQPEKQVDDKPASKGYQRTEHVDTYYRLADF
jgi:hypothetical protein